MKRTLVIICTLLAGAGCQRSDQEEQATSPTMLPPPATDMGTPRHEPSGLDPTLNPPASALERQNVSGTDDPAAGTAPGAATQNTSDRVLTQRVREAITSDEGLSATAKKAAILASDGVVTLRGPVSSSQEKTRMTTLVGGIEGVKRIENQLKISGD